MEFVATVSHSTNLVCRETVINELSLSFLEYGMAILVDTKTQIVLDVRRELYLRQGFVLKEIGLLLEQAQNHSLGVSVSV